MHNQVCVQVCRCACLCVYVPGYIEAQVVCFSSVVYFLRQGISLTLKLIDSDILATQHASGILLSPASPRLAPSHAPLCLALYVGFRDVNLVLPGYASGTLLTAPSPQPRKARFIWGSDANLNCIVDSEIISSGLLSDRCSS